jgi:hypothetical protein
VPFSFFCALWVFTNLEIPKLREGSYPARLIAYRVIVLTGDARAHRAVFSLATLLP